MHVKILQLKDISKVNYAFMSYEYAIKHNFTLDDYQEIYEYDIKIDKNDDIFDILENIYTKFNINIPQDFKGHSLSVSDLIKLNDDGIYYVDMVAFQPVNRYA